MSAFRNVVEFRFAKNAAFDPDAGLRLSYSSVSCGEDAVPVRLTTFPDMTSVHLLEPAVPIQGLIQTGRHLHHDSGRMRITREFPVIQELRLVAVAVRNVK